MASRVRKPSRVVSTIGGPGVSGLIIDVKGMEDAKRVLRGFERRALISKFRKAMRRVGNDLRNAIRREAPRSRRTHRSKLYRSVQVKPLLAGGLQIGPAAPHRYIVIRGTRDRYTKSGAYRGRMPGDPFVDHAVEPKLGWVLGKVRDEVLKR